MPRQSKIRLSKLRVLREPSLTIYYSAPLPVESDVESVVDEIPHTKDEPAKTEDVPADSTMKDEEDDEEEGEEEDGET